MAYWKDTFCVQAHILVLNTLLSNGGSGEPVHMCSLTQAFAACMKKYDCNLTSSHSGFVSMGVNWYAKSRAGLYSVCDSSNDNAIL